MKEPFQQLAENNESLKTIKGANPLKVSFAKVNVLSELPFLSSVQMTPSLLVYNPKKKEFDLVSLRTQVELKDNEGRETGQIVAKMMSSPQEINDALREHLHS